MDGSSDDADVLLLLTTNRPDLLEPALASRPDRIHLAVEVPLPDDHCRRRLFELYRKGLEWAVKDEDRLIARTHGVSAAFIRELLRKAALFAADERTTAVTDAHLDAALRELAVDGGALTKTLLGAGGAASYLSGDQPTRLASFAIHSRSVGGRVVSTYRRRPVRTAARSSASPVTSTSRWSPSSRTWKVAPCSASSKRAHGGCWLAPV